MRYTLNLDIEFRKNPYKGLYIALEGIDGSGKSTQQQALSDYFAKHGQMVIPTCEPRVDLPGGEIIMQYFKSEIALPAMAFQHFATANRVVNQDRIIIPALEKGEIVISDRCFWSAVPYGLMDKGVSFTSDEAQRMLVTQSLLSHYHQFITPDVVFYIDISASTGLARSLKKKNRRELDIYEKREKLERVVRGYQWLVKEYKDEFVTIDGEKKMEEITDVIITYLHKKKLIL